MTPKSLLMTALAVGCLLLHGTGALSKFKMTPKVMTDAELAELDTKLEAMSVEDVQKHLQKQKADTRKMLEDSREPLKKKIDEFVDKAIAANSKEATPEELAALEKKLADFSVEDAKKEIVKMKDAVGKVKSLMAELQAMFPKKTAPQ